MSEIAVYHFYSHQKFLAEIISHIIEEEEGKKVPYCIVKFADGEIRKVIANKLQIITLKELEDKVKYSFTKEE